MGTTAPVDPLHAKTLWQALPSFAKLRLGALQTSPQTACAVLAPPPSV